MTCSDADRAQRIPVPVGLAKRKNPLTIAVNGSDEWALRVSNPRPLGCDTSGDTSQDPTNSTVTPTPSGACTTACTNSPKTTNATDLDALAAELMKLPKEERARLLAKLLGEGGAG